MPIVCGGVVYALVTDAYEAFEHFGFFKFLTSSEWSYTEGAEQYGALPFITGTLMTTLLALIFCIPFSLPVALFVGEYFKGTKIAAVLSTAATFVPLKYSPTNNATGNENGIQNTRARSVVISVPVMKGNAPYCSAPSV